ncbi:hypothetical protein [Staphylococcus cornubiensis]|uniref:hypothetical protein n=1 Tax=Staphylococcus cornubiensis TaxID=1986155 RepID=UPI000A3C6104|nr:hypothetical protein [Staphylococcus cornubiensis]
MKKSLFLLISSLLLLGACGNDESKKETTKKEIKSPEKTKDELKEEKNTKENEPPSTEGPVTSEYNQQSDNVAVSEQSQLEYIQQTPQYDSQQMPKEYTSQQNHPVQENKKAKIDLNSLPPTDFSTEGMSEQAKKQIEELTIQKDFQGLPQEEYNDRVSEIINNENQ